MRERRAAGRAGLLDLSQSPLDLVQRRAQRSDEHLEALPLLDVIHQLAAILFGECDASAQRRHLAGPAAPRPEHADESAEHDADEKQQQGRQVHDSHDASSNRQHRVTTRSARAPTRRAPQPEMIAYTRSVRAIRALQNEYRPESPRIAL